MSVATPYVAPWESGFKRYSTQLYTPTLVIPSVERMTIPDGQWWRIIYLNGTFGTSAIVGPRTVFVVMQKPGGAIVFQEYAPASPGASAFANYLYGPGLTAFANTTDPTAVSVVATLPDLLWQPGTVISLQVAGAQAGDSWQGAATYAVEVYTPEKEGSSILVPTPAIP